MPEDGKVELRVGDMNYRLKPQRRDDIMAILSPVGSTGVLCSESEHMDIAQKNIDTAIQTLLNAPKQGRGKGNKKVEGIWMPEEDKMATTNALNQASAIINRQVDHPEEPPEAEKTVGEEPK